MTGSLRKKRLLYITDTYVGGKAGSERHLYNLVTRLDADRYDITIVQLTRKTAIPYTEGLMKDRPNVRIVSKPVGRIYGPAGIRALRSVIKLAGDADVDIVQSFHEKADIINALIPKRGDRPLKISSRRDMGFKKSRRLHSLFRRLNRRFDILCAPSRAILDGLAQTEKADVSQTHLLYNGVDLDRFDIADAKMRASARELIGIPEDAVCLGCVANLKPVKGHTHLIEAFGRIAPGHTGVRLVLVGDGELRSELEAQARAAGCDDRVLFLGQRNDVNKLLNGFDVLISSSLSEGLSNALIEAAACGLPIVATAVGGNPEVVVHGQNGYLVKPGDTDDLERHIRLILEDEPGRRRMGSAARELARNRFSMDGMMAAYRRMYSGVAAVPPAEN